MSEPSLSTPSPNPSEAAPVRVTEETRIPMGNAEQQLAVPEIPGYVTYWFLDRPGRIQKARLAGWEHVKDGEVVLNNRTIGGEIASSGNTDLGAQVSVFGGVVDDQGHTARLYLMKIRKEWYDKDMASRQKVNDRIAQQLLGGMTGAEKEALEDAKRRYSKVRGNLFTPKS